MRRVATGLAIRFFGCVCCGLALSLVAWGLWIVVHPYAHDDTWADVRFEVRACAIIGAFAGTIVGALWCLAWIEKIWSERRRAGQRDR